jgi:hypothetical protein
MYKQRGLEYPPKGVFFWLVKNLTFGSRLLTCITYLQV